MKTNTLSYQNQSQNWIQLTIDFTIEVLATSTKLIKTKIKSTNLQKLKKLNKFYFHKDTSYTNKIIYKFLGFSKNFLGKELYNLNIRMAS